MARLINSKSILVNKGLRNEGSKKIIERLRKTKRNKDFVIGISLARTNDSTRADTEEGMNDYINSLRSFVSSDIGDYYAINISCPNAFGGESFAEPKLLDELCTRLDMVSRTKPLLFKLGNIIDS